MRKSWRGQAAWPRFSLLWELAELLRSFDASAWGVWTFAALALCVCAASLSAHSAMLDLDQAMSTERCHVEMLAEALQRADALATGHEAWREEMTHDACNALAGLRGALQTLERYDGRLDDSTASRLRTAAIAELRHLEHLIVATKEESTRDFDVAEVVAMVVETRRARGTTIQVWGGGEVHAHGRPADLATALQNLLVNAEVHAPGSPVVVHVSRGPAAVEIVVCDSGPGLTADEVAWVFERGTRGSSSQGSGLGLHLARQAMRNQGGDLELLARQGGATFALSLPSSEHAVPRLPVQRSPAPLRESA